MKILIIRHGDPDYAIDGLTEKGKREAALLSDRLVKEDIKKVYCSVLGRARLTAQPTLDRLGITAEYCEWLREFDYAARVKLPYLEEETGCVWDIMPEYLNTLSNIYSPTEWYLEEFLRDTEIKKHYDAVCAEFDKVLAECGYVRDGYNYKAVRSNHDTIVFVCHYGLSAVLLSHILNCSPYSIWQNMVALTTSVTTIYTEERQKGVASMRCSGFSDISHLAVGGEEPAFAARFCECYEDDTRH